MLRDDLGADGAGAHAGAHSHPDERGVGPVVFALNIFAFIFIGLQIRPIIVELAPPAREQYLLVAGAVLATVIAVRIVWHMLFNAVIRWLTAHGFNPPRPMLQPTVGSGMVISWAGMRGIVTLAAALALPDGFPSRDLILLTAFLVVLGTLLIQGLTLKALLRALNLHAATRWRAKSMARASACWTPPSRSCLPAAHPPWSWCARSSRFDWASCIATTARTRPSASSTTPPTAPRCKLRGKCCSPCATAVTSATTPSTRWRTTSIGWKFLIRCARPMRMRRSRATAA